MILRNGGSELAICAPVLIVNDGEAHRDRHLESESQCQQPRITGTRHENRDRRYREPQRHVRCAGQVPAVELDDGRTLAQSNAIIRYLARGSDLIPQDAFAAAKMDEWLFWEQYSHEPYIAVCRFQMVYLGKPASDLDPDKIKRGYAALARMEHQLANTPFLVGAAVSLADVSLLAYTRLAHEGGFHLDGYAAVRRWIGETEKSLGLSPAR
jgi:glutathione S-transferase